MEGKAQGGDGNDADSEAELAAAFARRLNVNATAFVMPSFAMPGANGPSAEEVAAATAPTGNGNLTDDKTPSPETTPAQEIRPSAPAVVAKVNVDLSPVDDWEANADEEMNEEDEEDMDDENEEGEDEEGSSADIEKPKSKPIKKKRMPSESLDPEKRKEHLNIIFIGHVDAGKSTIGGQLLYLTGMVDKRTLEKYEREAKEKNRESWYLSWALDTNQEERDKGKTVEVGRAYFTTEHKYFTLLDAPGKRFT